MTGERRQSARRARVLTSLLWAPVVLTALTFVAMEGWRSTHPESRLFVTPFVYTLADAIERDDVDRAFEFIRAGQNPNDLISVRHPVITDGRAVLVSPLLWAVATGSRQSVLMLLGYGARIDHAAETKASCLADALDNEELAAVLRRHGAHSTDSCGEPKPVGPPLLSFVSE